MQTSPAKEAAEALGDIGYAAVPGLLQALTSSEWKVRKFAAIGLGEMDQIVQRADVIDALAGRLTDAQFEVRDQSAWALGEIEHPSAVSGLVTALNDSDAAVREKSVWALGEIESGAAVEGLTRALKDDDWQVRKTAAWALGEIEDPSAIDELRAAAQDANGEVRARSRRPSASSAIGVARTIRSVRAIALARRIAIGPFR